MYLRAKSFANTRAKEGTTVLATNKNKSKKAQAKSGGLKQVNIPLTPIQYGMRKTIPLGQKQEN